MKLLECHIENFGTLHGLDMDFSDGLNSFLQENGWGKSTFADFLLVMFYGFENETKKNLLENERRRFAPWQGGIYGGTIRFEARGREYRLERSFGARDRKEDLFALYDEETGLLSEDFSENLGQELFGIDRNSFCRSMFIAQQDCRTNVTPGISAKIGDLADESADISDYESVSSRLKKEEDSLTPKRKTGLLYRKKEQIALLQAQIQRKKPLENSAEQLRGRIDQLEEREEENRINMSRLQKELAEVSEQKDAQAARAQLRALTGGRDAAKERCRKIEQQLQESRQLCRNYEEEIRKQLELEFLQMRPSRRIVHYIPASILLAAAGLMIWLFFSPLGAILLAAGILLLILFLYARKDQSGDSSDDQTDPYRKQLMLEEGRQKQLMRDAEEADAELRAREEELREFIRLEEKEKQQDSVQSETEEKKMTQLAERFRALKEEKEQLEKELRSYERQLEEDENALEELAQKEQQFADEKEAYAQLLHRYEIISLTRQYLEEARVRFSARYMEPVKRSFDRYYALISPEDPLEYRMDANLNVTAVAQGTTRDTGYLSEGLQDLIGLCRRMALIDAMYPDDKPFLILDDPFVNLDDTRIRGGMTLIRELALDRQVIYFSCSVSRM